MRSTRRRAARAPIATVAAGLAVAALAVGSPVHVPLAEAAPADDASSHVILDYDFDAAASVTATVKDESGKGRDGVLANPGSAQLVDGPAGGKALHLSGGAAGSTTAPFITVPSGLFQGLTSTTISSWVKWDVGDAFQWLYTLGKDKDRLAAVIGDKAVPRTEVTKKVWEYIKKNNLQDATKRTMINADPKLKEIFKKPQVSMFEMTKLINAHLS